jgi:hypothetical protein
MASRLVLVELDLEGWMFLTVQSDSGLVDPFGTILVAVPSTGMCPHGVEIMILVAVYH